MNKPVIIQFDEQAYKEYQELQKLVAEGKSSKKKPTYEQLLTSINNAIRNIKADYCYGNIIPRKYISKSTLETTEFHQFYDWWSSGILCAQKPLADVHNSKHATSL